MKNRYLEPSFFIDSSHENVATFAEKHYSPNDSETERAVKLYYAVRDGFKYNPYCLDFKKESLKASYLLEKNEAYCVEKAIILAAIYRYSGLPARLGFGIVKNHIGSKKLEQFLQTNLLVFHGYTEVWLNNKWVKATPAFNKELCQILGVPALDFNGKEDSVFQKYKASGSLYMEYVHDYGRFSDLPYNKFISELKKHYSKLFESKYFDKKNKTVCYEG
ncbi:MAG: transglutaminase-like domain-containing protein [Bacteroidota bacterium]|nr:transglutaminase-like domain-containing protein [Bacteroidota bacterium]